MPSTPWVGIRPVSSMLEPASDLAASGSGEEEEEDEDSPLLIPKEADDCTCDTMELCQICQSFQVCSALIMIGRGAASQREINLHTF